MIEILLKKFFELLNYLTRIIQVLILNLSSQTLNLGKISLKNLKKISRELGESLSDEELQAMIDEFDKDQDGYSK